MPASRHALAEHRLVDDQFADEIDQAVDAIEIDANRRPHRGAGLRLRRHRLDRARRGMFHMRRLRPAGRLDRGFLLGRQGRKSRSRTPSPPGA